MTIMDDNHGWQWQSWMTMKSWMTIMDENHGWQLWMTIMTMTICTMTIMDDNDNHGWKWQSCMTIMDDYDNNEWQWQSWMTIMDDNHRCRVAKTFLKKSVQKSVHFQKKFVQSVQFSKKNPYNLYNFRELENYRTR